MNSRERTSPSVWSLPFLPCTELHECRYVTVSHRWNEYQVDSKIKRAYRILRQVLDMLRDGRKVVTSADMRRFLAT